ncbi:MAG: metallophosphoesterase [Rhizobiaceae bacterium]
MRLWVYSDLHLEFGGISGNANLVPPPQVDACVVAGDVTTCRASSIRWLHKAVAQHGIPVIFVPGNHEFYGNSVFECTGFGMEAAMDFPDVHLLDSASVVIAGVRFVGATLWTDYALNGDVEFAKAVAYQQMNDHRRIAYRFLPVHEAFTPDVAATLYLRQRHWLKRELQQPFHGPTVVVTHHAPHGRSVHRRYKGSALNPAFASDLTDVITHWQPQLWVHGHMHDTADYEVGHTRVVCDPKGYGCENAAFDPHMILEV